MNRERRWRFGLVPVVAVGAMAVCALAGESNSRAAVGGAPDAALRGYHSANGLLNRGLYDLAATEYRKFLEANRGHASIPDRPVIWPRAPY